MAPRRLYLDGITLKDIGTHLTHSRSEEDLSASGSDVNQAGTSHHGKEEASSSVHSQRMAPISLSVGRLSLAYMSAGSFQSTPATPDSPQNGVPSTLSSQWNSGFLPPNATMASNPQNYPPSRSLDSVMPRHTSVESTSSIGHEETESSTSSPESSPGGPSHAGSLHAETMTTFSMHERGSTDGTDSTVSVEEAQQYEEDTWLGEEHGQLPPEHDSRSLSRESALSNAVTDLSNPGPGQAQTRSEYANASILQVPGPYTQWEGYDPTRVARSIPGLRR